MATATVTQTVTGTQTLTGPKAVTQILEARLKEKRINSEGYFLTPIVWKNALGFLALHLLAVYGLWLLFTRAMLVTTIYAVLFDVVCGLGVTVGAHRLFTHRSFKATWGARLVLVILHTIAGQNCMYIWVRDHRQHHKYSDTHADPHNANRGFFFSHIGWLMMRKHPEVLRMGKNIDMSDLEADPIVMFQKKYYKTLYFFFAILLPVGLPFLWGEHWTVAVFSCYFARMIILLNITWLVNSAAHIYGTRPFNKNILAVETELVAFLSLGEGWHNYHHCFPWDYRAAELGSKHDLSTKVIDWMARKGWATDLKYASESLVRKRAMACGDGTHPRYGHHAPPPPETDPAFASVAWAKDSKDEPAPAAGPSTAPDQTFVQTLPAKEAAAMSLS